MYTAQRNRFSIIAVAFPRQKSDKKRDSLSKAAPVVPTRYMVLRSDVGEGDAFKGSAPD